MRRGREAEKERRRRFNEQSDFNDALKMSVDGKRLHWISFSTGSDVVLPFSMSEWVGG